VIGWLFELFCPHRWRCIKVYHYIDTSWDSRAPSTCATFRCERCGKLKERSMYGAGHLSKDELNSKEPA
jgi:hypothetical protein